MTIPYPLRVLPALVQFLPLSVFASYAFWRGVPDAGRWVEAFQVGAFAAAVELAVLLPRARPTNRLILGANLYLLVGGVAAFAGQWWVLKAYDVLKESGIFVAMLAVGVVTTVATPAGFVALADADGHDVRRASLWLLAATALALAMSIAFRGDRFWAAAGPVTGLALLQRVLARRARTPREAAPAA